MAGHLRQGEKNGRGRVAVALCLVAVALASDLAWALLGTPGQGDPSGAGEGVPPDGVPTVTEGTVGSEGGGDESALPFSISGVPTDAPVVEVSAAGDPVALADEWTFGGDYVTIGSFPLDADSVFGSSTSTPDDSSSYAASIIGRDGSVTALETPGVFDGLAWEPQDGSGDASQVVWRSSSMSFSPSSVTDNWRVQAWSAETGSSVVLGTASELNGTDQTPMLDGEVVPTANASDAYFASYRQVDGEWRPCVLSYDLDAASGEPVVVGEGSYPAAVDGGALWAGDVLSSGDSLGYGALYLWDGSDSTEVLSLSSDEGSWSISGVWASAGHRVVSLSSSDAARGAYIGVWEGDFERCVAWLHTPAPRVIASLNDEWVVWGAGSELESPGMFAYRLSSGETAYLGSSPGYSRPSIARGSNAVLVPECDGQNAAVFHVGLLG